MQHLEHDFGQANTTDAFAAVGQAFDKTGALPWTVTFVNSGANGASYEVSGSIDGVTWVVVAGGTGNVAAGATAVVSDGVTYWPRLRVRVKAQVPGSQTTVTATAVSLSGAS